MDELETFVKFDLPTPSSVTALTTKSQEYDYDEILVILAIATRTLFTIKGLHDEGKIWLRFLEVTQYIAFVFEAIFSYFLDYLEKNQIPFYQLHNYLKYLHYFLLLYF